MSKLISTNHKSKEALEKKNWLVRKYYEIYPLFAYCCVGAEVFYLLLYLLHFLPDSKFLYWVRFHLSPSYRLYGFNYDFTRLA